MNNVGCHSLYCCTEPEADGWCFRHRPDALIPYINKALYCLQRTADDPRSGCAVQCYRCKWAIREPITVTIGGMLRGHGFRAGDVVTFADADTRRWWKRAWDWLLERPTPAPLRYRLVRIENETVFYLEERDDGK